MSGRRGRGALCGLEVRIVDRLDGFKTVEIRTPVAENGRDVEDVREIHDFAIDILRRLHATGPHPWQSLAKAEAKARLISIAKSSEDPAYLETHFRLIDLPEGWTMYREDP